MSLKLCFFVNENYFTEIGFIDGSVAPSDQITYSKVGWDYAYFGELETLGEKWFFTNILTQHPYYFWNAFVYSVVGTKVFAIFH